MTNNYSIKFSRDQIDSINDDIRYPIDFFVDLHFDNDKQEILSSFDEYSIYWKSLLSEFISKSLKDKKDNNNDKIKEINNIVKNNINTNININEEIKDKDNNNINEEDINEIGNTNNTLDKVNLLLKQLEGNNSIKNNNNIDDFEEEDVDEDEDIQKYLKSLESK